MSLRRGRNIVKNTLSSVGQHVVKTAGEAVKQNVTPGAMTNIVKMGVNKAAQLIKKKLRGRGGVLKRSQSNRRRGRNYFKGKRIQKGKGLIKPIKLNKKHELQKLMGTIGRLYKKMI
jgi:hypothetical protein